jgi:hypothetical protein
MSTKSCSNKKRVELQVDKYDDVDQAVVMGESDGSACRKVLNRLNKVDPKKCFWSNAEINSVSESFGLIFGSIPVMFAGALGTIVKNGIFCPITRVVKNRKYNKHDATPAPEDINDCDEPDDAYGDSGDGEHQGGTLETCGCDAPRTIDFGEDDFGEDDFGEDDLSEDDLSEDGCSEDGCSEDGCSEDGCSEDGCSEDDYVCKKKKKNPFSTLWNKIAKRK